MTAPRAPGSPDLARKLVAEAIGTALLLAIVVGSGIMGERLAEGNDAIALLGNSLASGAGLTVLILVLGPVSGAHLNPAVTLAFWLRREIEGGRALLYAAIQIASAPCGVLVAHLMFGEDLLMVSSTVRTGLGPFIAEVIATFGLCATILGCARAERRALPFAVGLYITAGYWFTASTSFANPAVTLARGLTDTFAGIHPDGIPAFVAAQLVGALLATALFGWLFRTTSAARERAGVVATSGIGDD
jgi:glycerol uptake facilitator-like aquaporin